jgi:hypothetical protein
VVSTALRDKDCEGNQRGYSGFPAVVATLRSHKAAIPEADYVNLATVIVDQISNQTTPTVTQTGIGLGSAVAVVCSWQRNRSILWAILAGILS